MVYMELIEFSCYNVVYKMYENSVSHFVQYVLQSYHISAGHAEEVIPCHANYFKFHTVFLSLIVF